MNKSPGIAPSWFWGTAEGSRQFDRLTDRMLTFREKLEWLEEAEELSLRLHAARASVRGLPPDEAREVP